MLADPPTTGAPEATPPHLLQGPPPEWYGEPAWDRRDIKRGATDLGGHRALLESRSSDQRRAWRQNQGAQAALQQAIKAVLVQLYEKHQEVGCCC